MPNAMAQPAVHKSFEFLQVPNSARVAGVGGVNVSLKDRDINFFFNNPALVSDSLTGYGSASYQFYVADIGLATFSYALSCPKIGTLILGIQHLDYGEIMQYDASGMALGEARSGETALMIGKQHQIGNFRLGVNLKMAFSNLAGYRAGALLTDIGGLFVHPDQELSVGLTMHNLGVVFAEYSETSKTRVPWDIQLGVTFKPEHMPVRFSITGYNLAFSEASYFEPPDGTTQTGTLDKVLRRLNFGTEILIHRHVNLLVGYNYRVHRELKLADVGGLAGWSFGFSAQVKSFELVFSRSSYVIGSAGYAFTLSKNLSNLMKRR